MKYTRYYLLWFVIVTSVTILLTACRKDHSKVGFDIQPDSDLIELYGDDSTVLFVSYTVEHDSISTSNMEILVLGSVNDPLFGSTQAAFNTQFRLSQVNPFFGKDVTFDSICLHLGYAKEGQWGDSTTFLTANVYRLTDSLYFNSDTTLGEIKNNYYATDVAVFDPVPIGTKTFLPQPLDSVELKRFWLKRNQDMHAPFISIRLDDEFGKKLLADTAALTSNDDFLKSFYGLRMDVAPVAASSFGKMIYFDRGASETKLVLYYTNSDSSTSYSFVIDRERSIRFNEYKIDHSTAYPDLQNQLNSTSPLSGNQRLYLQPFSGVRIKVDFSGIEKFREKKNIVINNAQLYLNNAEPYNKNLPPVQQLTTYTIKDGKIVWTPDSELFNAQYLGGKFDADKNRYVMRITRYLQKRILNPDMDNDDLYISIYGASNIANRVMLYGNNPDDKPEEKAMIRILYSEY